MSADMVHKIMSRSEYDGMNLTGWHEVCHNFRDEDGATAIRYSTPASDALEYALGALRVVAAGSKNSSPGQLAAIAQSGIDLATLGEQQCAKMRGDGE